MSIELDSLLEKIKAPDQAAMDAARAYQATLAKPPESLGRLEALSIQLAGITGKIHNRMERTHLLVFAADNGVVEEGVSSAPQSVTLQQTINLTRAKTGASTLCRHFGVGITVCDVGVNAEIHDKAVLNRKIAYGTNNIAKMPAMTREQAITAILTGAGVAIHTEADALGVGEMGIGNTTTSAAVLSALLDVPPEQAFLGGAATRRPGVIDGFISAVAALCAVRLKPEARHYLVPSHASFEIGYTLAMQAMDLQPMLLLGMRLGEGSGCPLAFQVLDAACAIINEMATFQQAGIDDGYLEEIRQGDKFTVEGRQ